ncbi:MAG: MliC family protein [Desulfopila sp.]|jgi:uncharacterized protein|nr:MliC family protein [Desulfopila sp.]
MNKLLVVLFILQVFSIHAVSAEHSDLEKESLCSDSWEKFIEAHVPTGDGKGHGPDPGSDEWKSVVEFKLGISDRADIPDPKSESWCRHIDQIVRSKLESEAAGTKSDHTTSGTAPSFDCSRVAAGSIEAMICADKPLSALDRNLAKVYAAALNLAEHEHPPVLKAEQRGWIKGRNECWKSADKRECVRNSYQQRIVELQAAYRLVPFNGPVSYLCNDNPANEFIVTFFHTEPPTLIAERGDSTSLMYLQPSASGSRYQGRNEAFWEHAGTAVITWGYDAEELRCVKHP